MKRIITAAIALTFCVSCDSSPAPAEKGHDDHGDHGAHDDHGDHAHAPSSYEPGTHADWCGEHQVQESKCTRCNPSLAAAFKATGDWCKEHEVPKSQCLACDPKLVIERPPKAAN